MRKELSKLSQNNGPFYYFVATTQGTQKLWTLDGIDQQLSHNSMPGHNTGRKAFKHAPQIHPNLNVILWPDDLVPSLHTII